MMRTGRLVTSRPQGVVVAYADDVPISRWMYPLLYEGGGTEMSVGAMIHCNHEETIICASAWCRIDMVLA